MGISIFLKIRIVKLFENLYTVLNVKMLVFQITMFQQLMVSEAWLFIFYHKTPGCDVNVVKNYLNKYFRGNVTLGIFLYN